MTHKFIWMAVLLSGIAFSAPHGNATQRPSSIADLPSALTSSAHSANPLDLDHFNTRPSSQVQSDVENSEFIRAMDPKEKKVYMNQQLIKIIEFSEKAQKNLQSKGASCKTQVKTMIEELYRAAEKIAACHDLKLNAEPNVSETNSASSQTTVSIGSSESDSEENTQEARASAHGNN